MSMVILSHRPEMLEGDCSKVSAIAPSTAVIVSSKRCRAVIHSWHLIMVWGVPTASKTAWTTLVLPVASSPCTIIVGGLGMAGWD